MPNRSVSWIRMLLALASALLCVSFLVTEYYLLSLIFGIAAVASWGRDLLERLNFLAWIPDEK